MMKDHPLAITLIDRTESADRDAIILALRWLNTLIQCPAVTWNAGQREAAQQALADAQQALLGP